MDAEKFIYSKANRDLIRKTFHCEDKSVIANVGAFLPVKNHEFMVRAFEVYSRKNPNAVLWFIGDGAGRPAIEKMVEEKGLTEKVLFLGIRSDMAELYAGMDLFWFPSLYEGFGNVLLEAECEGVPCLTSDCIPQDACVAENTFSFSLSKSLEEWADMIDLALSAQVNDKENRYKLMDEKGFSVQKEIAKLQDLYCEMLK